MSATRDPPYGDKANTPARDSVTCKFFPDEQARVLALQGNTAQLVSSFTVSGGQALLTDPNVAVLAIKSSAHRQVHMRTDIEPFTDKSVRQAVALSLNRPDVVQGLLNGKAQIADDSPFFKIFPSTDSSH